MKNKFEIRGDKVAIFLKRRDKSIIETIIDLDDLGNAQGLNGTWHAYWNNNTRSFYAVATCLDKNKTVRLHRVILNTPDFLHVDHVSHDTLNNSKSNIRNVTRSENMQNRVVSRSTTSGFLGVTWNKRDRNWRAHMKLNGKSIHIGFFDEVELAAEASRKARIKYMPGYVDRGKVVETC